MGNENGKGAISIVPKVRDSAKNPFTYIFLFLAVLGGAAGREVIITFGGEKSQSTQIPQSELKIQKLQMEQLKEVQVKQDRRLEKVEDIQAKQTVTITKINSNLENQNEKLRDIKSTVETIQRRLPRRTP